PTPAAQPVFRARPAQPLPVARHHHGASTTTTLLLITVPGVLAATALRPGRGRGRGRSAS
ncbi:hypothetical protein J0670_35195, partial [Streptomyces sp. FH025]|nr:hypothetical protein [Streptomyces sp. FH025]